MDILYSRDMLVYQLLMRLGFIHAMCGVNLGRAPRSVISETLIELWRICSDLNGEDVAPMEEIPHEELMAIAADSDPSPQLTLFESGEHATQDVSNYDLAAELAYHLWQRYENEDLKGTPEYEIVQAIRHLLPTPRSVPDLEASDAVFEARERIYRHLASQLQT